MDGVEYGDKTGLGEPWKIWTLDSRVACIWIKRFGTPKRIYFFSLLKTKNATPFIYLLLLLSLLNFIYPFVYDSLK